MRGTRGAPHSCYVMPVRLFLPWGGRVGFRSIVPDALVLVETSIGVGRSFIFLSSKFKT